MFWETEAELKRWLRFKLEHAPEAQSWRAELPASKRHVVGKLDLAVLQASLQEAGHPDADFLIDLINGFPITGVVGVGGLGTDVPGGLLSRGRRSTLGPLPMDQLRRRCEELNAAMLRKASSRRPKTSQDHRIFGGVAENET